MNPTIDRMVGRCFLQATNNLRNIPKNQRNRQLQRILTIKRSSQQFNDVIPDFPIQYHWFNQNSRLRAVTWQPTTPPTALIISYHCLNGHSGLSSPIAQHLSKLGCVFTSFDYPNFGDSESPQRGHIQSMDSLLELCCSFLEHSKAKYPNMPTFLLGYSLGGLMAMRVGVRKASTVDGCIFINPSFQDNPIQNQFLKKVVILCSKFLPKFQTFKPSRGQSSNLSLNKYKEKDSLMYSGKPWTSTSGNILLYMKESLPLFSKFNIPYLYIQGGADKTVNLFKAFDFQQESKSKDKQTVIIPDLWHSVWFDEQLPHVINLSQQWLRQRI